MTSDGTRGPTQIDWSAGVRRERRREAEGFLLLVAALGALVVVLLDLSSGEDRDVAIVVAAGLALTVVGAAAWFTAGLLGGRTDRYRAAYALVEHLDPGPGARGPADRLARRHAESRRRAWTLPVVGVYAVISGRWDHLVTTLPATVVIALCLGLAAWRLHGTGTAARRWLADPPGPPRITDPA